MIDREYWRLARTVDIASVFRYSDQYSSSYRAEYAVDGNIGNYWRTNNPAGAYIVVELADAAAIESLRWYVGNTTYYAKEFTVSGSNDGESFTELFSGGCTNASGWQLFNWVNETPYKYIRITCNTPNNTSRLYTYELEFGIFEKKYFDKSYGKYIVAVFDGPVSAPTENDVQHFSVTAHMAIMENDGHLTLKPIPRTISSIVPHPDVENALLITLSTSERLDECWKPVILSYDGTGSMTGYGRPVGAFEFEFDPHGIEYKGDQNDSEHIEIFAVTANARVTKIEFSQYQCANEHLELSNVFARGFLTSVNDI